MRSKLFIAAMCAGFLTHSGSASAQQKFYVAAAGAAFEQMMRTKIIPQFEKQHNVTVEYVAGNSTDTLAKLQARKGNQQLDVVVLDDGPMFQAIQLGFCAKIEGLPVDDIYQQARFPEDRAVATSFIATGIMYNTQYFKEKGWAAPTSWHDLKDPKYRKLLVIPPISNLYGLYTLVMTAKLNGGGERNIEPGFKAMINDIGPNVLAFEPSPGKMTELFQSGQAVISVWGTTRAQVLANSGFPVEFVYPKEGAISSLVSTCPIEKAGGSKLGSEFIKSMLQADTQLTLLKEYGYAPVNKKVVVPEGAAKMSPVGKNAETLYNPDWIAINEAREDWTKRWNREVER